MTLKTYPNSLAGPTKYIVALLLIPFQSYARTVILSWRGVDLTLLTSGEPVLNSLFTFNYLSHISIYGWLSVSLTCTLLLVGLLIYQGFKHRRRLERQVENRTESLNNLLGKHLNITNSLPVGIALYVNGTLSELNPKMLTWFDEDKNEDLCEQLKPHLHEVFTKGERFKGQLQLQTSFGRKQMQCTALEIPSSTDAKQILVLLEDWTDQLRSEQALQDKTQELERHFTSSMDLLCISTLDGTFLNLNPQWEDTLDHPLTEMTGQNLLCFVKEEDSELAKSMLQKLRDAQIIQNESLRFVRRNGDDIWLEWKATREGNLIHANVRNVTERKLAEEKNLLMQKHLARAQKMESIGRLAGGIAHDFNNSLQVIMGNTELVLNSRGLPSTTQKQLKDILRAAEGSAQLTKQLLGFAMKQHFQADQISLNETLQQMEPMFKTILGDQIELEWSLDSTLGIVKIDKSQLEQICVNLLENAFNAMPKGGTVRIKTQNRYLSEIELTEWVISSEPGSYISLSIEDTGTGIDPDIRASLFEPFATTQETSKGSGLGLATVYGILQQNNGSVKFESQATKGTRLEIILPRDDTPKPDLPVQPLLISTDEHKIMFVDDNPQILQIGVLVLRQLGFEALSCSSPTEARDRLRKCPDISLLITDVSMPEISGPELYLEALKTNPELKCILVSGYSSDVVDTSKMEQNKWAFLSKPFSLLAIKETISDLLGG